MSKGGTTMSKELNIKEYIELFAAAVELNRNTYKK